MSGPATTTPWKEGIWLGDTCRAPAVRTNPTLPNVPPPVRFLQFNLVGDCFTHGFHFSPFAGSLHGSLIGTIEQALRDYLSLCWATGGDVEDMVALVSLPPPQHPGGPRQPKTSAISVDRGVSIDDQRVARHIESTPNLVAVVRLGAEARAEPILLREAGVLATQGTCIRVNGHFITTSLVGTAQMEIQLVGNLHARCAVHPRVPIPNEETGTDDEYAYVGYDPLLNVDALTAKEESTEPPPDAPKMDGSTEDEAPDHLAHAGDEPSNEPSSEDDEQAAD